MTFLNSIFRAIYSSIGMTDKSFTAVWGDVVGIMEELDGSALSEFSSLVSELKVLITGRSFPFTFFMYAIL